MPTPRITSSARFAHQQVVAGDEGSHSAPLITSSSIGTVFAGRELAVRGKTAPPRPTTPGVAQAFANLFRLQAR